MRGAMLLTTKEAARLLGLAPKTLENLRSRGGGPRYAKIGNRVRYRPADLDDWISERMRASTAGERKRRKPRGVDSEKSSQA